jgi:LytS/YehU family sensor histidine kinase
VRPTSALLALWTCIAAFAAVREWVVYDAALMQHFLHWAAWALLLPVFGPATQTLVGRPDMGKLVAFAAGATAIVVAHLALFGAARAVWSLWAAESVHGIPHVLSTDGLITLAFAGVAYAWQASDARRQQEVAAATAAADRDRAQLDALAGFLEPHFLFNALNTIAALVRENADEAERTIARVSSLLREAVRRDRPALVPLSAELELATEYLSIEQARFGDRLRTVQDLASDAGGLLVPRFLLQPLLENSVKHGLTTRPDGVTIRVSARRVRDSLVITLSDNGGADVDGSRPAHEGIGLWATRARLRHLYGDRQSLDIDLRPDGTDVRITLPAKLVPVAGAEHARSDCG